MARETFQIDPSCLKSLRTQSGKSQFEVGSGVRALLGHSDRGGTDDPKRSIISTYQKIERTGKTSKETAQALAHFFHVEVEVLQGLKPVDSVRRIMALLNAQFSAGNNMAFQRAYADHAHGLEDWTHEAKLHELALEIAGRLETAQWSRNAPELAALAAITGMSQKELLTPAYVRGYWWVTDSLHNESDARVVSGTGSASSSIRKAWEETPSLNRAWSQTTIRLSKSGLRFRVDAEVSGDPRPWWVECIRCEPEQDKGVRWCLASRWDQERLERGLRGLAFQNADVVHDFDGTRIPGDVRQLRFVVTSEQSNEGLAWQAAGKWVFRGDPIVRENLPETFEEARARATTLHWLKNDLKYSLHPHLRGHPAECWKVSEDSALGSLLAGPCSITVTQSQANPNNRFSREPVEVKRYHIALMAEVPEGEFVAVPWKTMDVKLLCDEVKQWVDAPLPDGWYGDAVQKFETSVVAK